MYRFGCYVFLWMCNSVFGSVLLPMNIAGMKNGSRLDFSGLEGGVREINVKSDVIVNQGSGVGLSMLCDILKWQKYECKSYKGPIEALEAIKEPLIAYWEKSHFVILEKVKSGIYHVVDPALGYVKYTKEEFAAGYSERFIYAVPGDDFEKNTKNNLFGLVI